MRVFLGIGLLEEGNEGYWRVFGISGCKENYRYVSALFGC